VNSDRIAEIQEIVRRSAKVHATGSKTKTGFHRVADEVVEISALALQGIVSYDPQEFVITVLSGTPISEVVSVLAEQGQYLPFDPLLSTSNATIGGTVASNAAGPGRFRFGGIRDFLLGVRFIDGRGNCVRGGGQVVKNAAGFDYPKLMVGSQGKLGLVYELTFKVFPRPESFATVVGTFSELDGALTCMNQIASSAMDAESLDLTPAFDASGRYELAIRIGGIATAIPGRLARLQGCLGHSRIFADRDDETYWLNVSNFEWASRKSILKLPITSKAIPELEQSLATERVPRRYSVGGNVVWIASQPNQALPIHLSEAQTFLGPANSSSESAKLGPFGMALKRAIDPEMKWV
jgi:glycolate oxidase FAD binding subunit